MQPSFAGVILFLAGYSSGLDTPELTGPGEVRGPLGESVSVQCRYHERYQGHRKYWCRGAVRKSCHIDVETTGSEAEAKRDRVSIRDNHRLSTFTVSLENLTLGDAGIYWCGISRVGYDLGARVEVTVLPGCFSALTAPREVSGPVGGTLSVPCRCHEGAEGSQKYWCRGTEWSSCSKVVETEESKVKVKKGRVSITDNHTTRTFTVTMENLTLGDAGIYWCGINIKYGSDSGSLVKVTVLPALSTTVMVTAGSPSPASTAEPHTSSPFTSAMVLLPVTLLVLLLLLIGAILLARRMMLKRKKAAGAVGPSQAVNEAVTSTESDVSYATVKPRPRKSTTTAPSPHSAQPGPERVDYAVVAAGRTDISYTSVKYPTLEDQPIYINVDRPSNQLPLSSPLERTEYCQVKKK